jgi:hypothetical protein
VIAGESNKRRARHLQILCTVLSITAAAGCAHRPPALPAGAGAPYPEYNTAYSQATERCRGVRTFAGVLELSGRVGSSKLPRTRIEAGFAEPDQIRLEAKAPFGRPIFVLVARRGDDATLVLPRDKRVLSRTPADAIVEALTGVRLGPGELRAIATGCGAGILEPQSGRAYEGGWLAVDGGDRTVWLRQVNGGWQVVGATRGPIEIRYDTFESGRPALIRIRTPSSTSGGGSDLMVRVSDVDINVALGPEVFQVSVPEDAEPLTLEELRRSGPLGSEAR